jgi:hypothetical protein
VGRGGEGKGQPWNEGEGRRATGWRAARKRDGGAKSEGEGERESEVPAATAVEVAAATATATTAAAIGTEQRR